MKYLKRVLLSEIRDKYDTVVAWGTGHILRENYRPTYYAIDFIVDGRGNDAGKSYRGIPIRDISILGEAKGKILIVIYAIYEQQILQQIEAFDHGNIDTIIYPLLRFGEGDWIGLYAKQCEDFLLLKLLRQIGLSDVRYLEIGVCHPIMRNNIYMLHKAFSREGSCHGVLVEPNPICWDIIEEYRPWDVLLKCGVGIENRESTFYMFPDLLGCSTFVKEKAEEKARRYGSKYEEMRIPTREINQIIAEHFDRTPDILAIDAEGMDFRILKEWDSDKYPCKLVVVEPSKEADDINQLMQAKGYRMYAKTAENEIWVRNNVKFWQDYPKNNWGRDL